MLHLTLAPHRTNGAEITLAFGRGALGAAHDRIVREVQFPGVIALAGSGEDVEVYVFGNLPTGIGAGADGLEFEATFAVRLRPASEAPGQIRRTWPVV